MERSLDLAGNNKIELLKVLEHFKNDKDSLKYKAACFLIANMFAHGCSSDMYTMILDSAKLEFKQNKALSTKTIELLDKCRPSLENMVYDVQKVSSQYLIENIELAFSQWEKRPWSKYYSFDEFCEYILPYRISTEPLQRWRRSYIDRYGFLLDSVYKGTDVIEASKIICERLREEGFVWTMEFSNMGATPPLFSLEHRIGSCFDAVSVATYTLRSLGVPTRIDGYRFSPETFSSHTWNVVLDTTKNNIPFYYMDYFPERGKMETDMRKKIKIYRTSFAYKEVETDSLLKQLTQANQIDVSSEYFKNELILPILDVDRNYYLCCFSREELKPVVKAQIKDKVACFGIIEDGNIFVLASSSSKDLSLRIESDAFLFTNGACHFLTPDIHNVERLILYRKFPLSKWGWGRLLRVVGGTFYGGNKIDKIDKKLYTVCDTPLIARNRYSLNLNEKIRFIKYVAPKDVPLELAELAILNDEKELYPIKIIGGEAYDPHDQNMQLENLFDKDFLTYFLSKERGDSIILDFGSPCGMTDVLCVPRNDDNFIRIGDKYALYYFDKEGWHLLTQKIATSDTISCTAPSNALLLLKDNTRGKEEQIFLYKNGQQFYLNML